MWDKIKKIIPNILTFLRLGIAVAMPFIILNGYLWLAFGTFLVGFATDLADGHLARRWGVESPTGKLVDPIADKSLVISTLGFSVAANLLMLIPILGEAVIMGIRGVEYLKTKKIPKVLNIGRIKTFPLVGTVACGLLTAIDINCLYALVPFMLATGAYQLETAKQYIDIIKHQPELESDKMVNNNEKEQVLELEESMPTVSELSKKKKRTPLDIWREFNNRLVKFADDKDQYERDLNNTGKLNSSVKMKKYR